MTTLYIAEKPDIARAIAYHLWGATYQKHNGYFQNDSTIVTWALGHLLEQAPPQAYGAQYGSWTTFTPIFPNNWILQANPKSLQQFNTIKSLLGQLNPASDIVIHAGDPDREGQLLIDEILEYCNYTGRVDRLLINAKDPVNMKRAFDNIVSNDNFRTLYQAGLARQRADWLVGMNLSKCYTINSSQSLVRPTWRVGRVKIPTLALVVNRAKEIAAFKPVDYYILKATFKTNGQNVFTEWMPGQNAPTDKDGRITDLNFIKNLRNQLRKNDGIVISFTKITETKLQPLPYSLDTLQVEANRQFGYAPKTVLDTVQKLYEKKHVTYPRSDCNYLPSAQRKDANTLLPKLAAEYGLAEATGADPAIVSPAWNNKKVTAHHAIIPTSVIPKNLSQMEDRIYRMIALRYILQFYDVCKIEKEQIEVQLGPELFSGYGLRITQDGFNNLYPVISKVELQQHPPLPQIAVKQNLGAPIYIGFITEKTKKPKPFTEGSLLYAMTNIWKYMDQNNPNIDKLKEVHGIGTPATRQDIIAELQESKGYALPYLIKSGKNLIPTKFAYYIIEHMDESLTKPDFTAEMELALSEIVAGDLSKDSYMERLTDMVNKNIQYTNKQTIPPWPTYSCPLCNGGYLVQHYSQKNNSYFYTCTNNCTNPNTNKPFFPVNGNGDPVVNGVPVLPVVVNPTNNNTPPPPKQNAVPSASGKTSTTTSP